MEVVFARTRFDYPPYADFFKLASLSGFPIHYLDEIDWQKQQIVISSPHNGEHLGVPQDRLAWSVLWNIERPTTTTDYRSGSPQMPYGIDEVWCSDAEIAHITGARYVFLGGHPAFAGKLSTEKKYDLISLMAWFGRRPGLRHEMEDLTWADVKGGTWGEERHQRLMQSKLMLSVHQDDYLYIEPVRYMLAGCYALPLLGEMAAKYDIWKPHQHFVPATYEDIPVVTRYLLKDEVRLARLSASIWRLVCMEHPFEQEVRTAIAPIEEYLSSDRYMKYRFALRLRASLTE